jgi:hypothetical protein
MLRMIIVEAGEAVVCPRRTHVFALRERISRRIISCRLSRSADDPEGLR